MKKTLLLIFALLTMGGFARAEVKVTVTPVGENPIHPVRKTASAADCLVRENFDNVTENDIDFENAFSDYYKGYVMDPALTHGDQWYSDRAYAAGGQVALCTPDPQGQAWIATPLGDYSGSVTVTFLAKYCRYDFETQEGKTVHWNGSSARLAISNDGEDYFNLIGKNGEQEDTSLLCDFRLYENQGWSRITVEFDNYSAYNDARLMFYTGNSIYIDDIEVYTSADKFVAAPIVTGIRDLTETSFTVDFQPVRKAYNYYVYLFTLDGYDEEGNPKYTPIVDPELQAELDELGMTAEEYLGSLYDRYCNYGSVESDQPTSFTFTDLDPTKDYYFGIRTHYVNTFSDYDIYAAKYIAAPEVNLASDITADSFKASWKPVAKAEKYQVNLYGVNEVTEDQSEYIIFEESFDNVSEYTDSNDILAPEEYNPESGLTLDDFTSTPGWDAEITSCLLVKGMLGLNYYNYWLTSPEIYVGNSDTAIIDLSCTLPTPDASFYITFAGEKYTIQAEGNRVSGFIEVPTNGLETTTFAITGPEFDSIFVDQVTITQSLKAGQKTFTFMGSAETAETSHTFSDIDTDRFDMYGYTVKSMGAESEKRLISGNSDRILVDFRNGSTTGINEIDNAEAVATDYYSIDGLRLSAPAKGLNIVKMSDGSVRKVFVK